MFPDFMLVLFAGLLTWFLLRLFPRADSSSRYHSQFHAVSVHPGSKCCQAASALVGKRFLSRLAPMVPLEACTAETCHCVYQHYLDRRNTHSDRRSRNTEKQIPPRFGVRNRRLDAAGRRQIDKNSSLSWA
jgi:hypothetical protein